jgi:hypothetical protein
VKHLGRPSAAGEARQQHNATSFGAIGMATGAMWPPGRTKKHSSKAIGRVIWPLGRTRRNTYIFVRVHLCSNVAYLSSF